MFKTGVDYCVHSVKNTNERSDRTQADACQPYRVSSLGSRDEGSRLVLSHEASSKTHQQYVHRLNLASFSCSLITAGRESAKPHGWAGERGGEGGTGRDRVRCSED
ncbi:hypothetical protein E2C01_005567 [Portunus trituberculatus]|uniref:Uncharacterized protein n=1 Tax=Portunus trituberculatus TaxID=210409 RepID=A0A5B7CZG9_PORTR|nr:hypothetical protein [Portunus trituberculatus]